MFRDGRLLMREGGLEIITYNIKALLWQLNILFVIIWMCEDTDCAHLAVKERIGAFGLYLDLCD
jgi:hypothetical protein